MGARRAYRDLEGARRQAGFTLVELLVAMTLLAFLSVALFGGLRFGARSWEAVVDSSAERDRIASTQTFLRDRLGQLTVPGPAGLRQFDADGRLDGGPERVEFVAPWLSALSLGGLYRFTLWHDDAGDGRLMLLWAPAEADPDALEELGDLAGERVLLDGVAEFSLSYLWRGGRGYRAGMARPVGEPGRPAASGEGPAGVRRCAPCVARLRGCPEILTVAMPRPRRGNRKAFIPNGNRHIIARPEFGQSSG